MDTCQTTVTRHWANCPTCGFDVADDDRTHVVTVHFSQGQAQVEVEECWAYPPA